MRKLFLLKITVTYRSHPKLVVVELSPKVLVELKLISIFNKKFSFFSFLFCSTAKYKIPTRQQQEIDDALNERHEMMRFKCFKCNLQIYIRMPFVRWQTMEFCSDECLKEFLLENCSACSQCNKTIGVNQLCDLTQRIGTELKHFCSSLCAKQFAESIRLCDFCFGNIDANDNATTFCNEQCKLLQEMLKNDKKSLADGKCTDCGSERPMEIQLTYNGEYFGFCSFKCFFFLKFSCGIYAGNFEFTF